MLVSFMPFGTGTYFPRPHVPCGRAAGEMQVVRRCAGVEALLEVPADLLAELLPAGRMQNLLLTERTQGIGPGAIKNRVFQPR